jgi:hypothetical protein
MAGHAVTVTTAEAAGRVRRLREVLAMHTPRPDTAQP